MLPAKPWFNFMKRWNRVLTGRCNLHVGLCPALPSMIKLRVWMNFVRWLSIAFPYRVWSSERAKEAMSCIADLLPNSVQGGVPARQAKSIWFELASALEWSYLNGDGLHGLLMDIQKCFNNIPRYPLCFALALMDFPQHILRAWVSFVSGQVRRFRVRRSVGAPVQSNCGLPEGCALSVFGMTIIDWMLDWWLQSLNCLC